MSRACGVVLGCVVVLASYAPSIGYDQPILRDGELIFPPNAEIPRFLTPNEIEYLKTHPQIPRPRAVTSPPTGPVHCAAEYEPMDGLLFGWQSFTSNLTSLIDYVTNEGAANAYVVVDGASEQSTVTTTLTNAGANMSRVKFITTSLNTVWIRDYGPRYIFEGNCRAAVDHDYNRPRPLDEVFPTTFANYKHHAYYEHQIIHGGGNYHLDALNRAYCTRLVVNENVGFLTELQIHDIWQSFLNVDTHFFDPFPTSVDLTQHLDMWMQIIADDRVVISDWPNNVGSTQDVICDNAATFMQSRGYTVYRTPARSISGVHYTYTNMVMCNNAVLLPMYSNANMTTHNTQAFNTMVTALSGTGKSVYQIPNCDSLASSAGVIHCIVMHVPQHRGAPGPNGGLSPTIYLKTLRGPQTLTPGTNVDIRWISDDDVSVSSVDILLSVDGGATYSTTLASATADDGLFTWTVPNLCTDRARIRVVARDGVGNTGLDQSSANLDINGSIPSNPGDMNCDCTADAADLPAFVLALVDPAGYAAAYPLCDINLANLNGDGQVDGRDAQAFADALIGP